MAEFGNITPQNPPKYELKQGLEAWKHSVETYKCALDFANCIPDRRLKSAMFLVMCQNNESFGSLCRKHKVERFAAHERGYHASVAMVAAPPVYTGQAYGAAPDIFDYVVEQSELLHCVPDPLAEQNFLAFCQKEDETVKDASEPA